MPKSVVKPRRADATIRSPSLPPVACCLLPLAFLINLPYLRETNFGWVPRSGHIFDSFYISPDWISPAGFYSNGWKRSGVDQVRQATL